MTNSTPVESTPSYSAPKRSTGSGMKLGGGKKKDINQFVNQLTSEGERIEEMPSAASRKSAAAKVSAIPEVDKERYVTLLQSCHFTQNSGLTTLVLVISITR